MGKLTALVSGDEFAETQNRICSIDSEDQELTLHRFLINIDNHSPTPRTRNTTVYSAGRQIISRYKDWGPTFQYQEPLNKATLNIESWGYGLKITPTFFAVLAYSWHWTADWGMTTWVCCIWFVGTQDTVFFSDRTCPPGWCCGFVYVFRHMDERIT